MCRIILLGDDSFNTVASVDNDMLERCYKTTRKRMLNVLPISLGLTPWR